MTIKFSSELVEQKYQELLQILDQQLETPSITKCKSEYRRIYSASIFLKKDFSAYQSLLERVAVGYCSLELGKALQKVEKIIAEQRLSPTFCKQYHDQLNYRQQLQENQKQIEINFVNKFSLQATFETPFEAVLGHLPDLAPLDEVDKLMVLDKLFRKRLVKLRNQKSEGNYIIYSKLKKIMNLKQHVIRVLQETKYSFGKGACASVNLVKDITYTTECNKFKALKIYFSSSPLFEQSFRNIRKLLRLHSTSSLVRMHILDNQHLLMKYYDSPLDQWLKILQQQENRSIELKKGLHYRAIGKSELGQIMKQTAKGLSYIHQAQLCHQNIRTSNVLIKNGKCALGNFNFLVDQKFTNINFLCVITSYTFLPDCYQLLLLINQAKKKVHEIDEQGFEIDDQDILSAKYTYDAEIYSKVMDLKRAIDVSALGILFFEAATGNQVFSDKNPDLFLKKVLDEERCPGLNLADYHKQIFLSHKLTKKGKELIEAMKGTYGKRVSELILSMIGPIDQRPTIKEVRKAIKKIMAKDSNFQVGENS